MPEPEPRALGEIFVTPSAKIRPTTDWLPVRRLRLLGYVGVAGLLILASRSAYLQVSHSGTYRTQAEGNRIRLLVEYAPRGVMFDRFGRQLVENVPSTDLVVYPRELPTDTEQVVAALREVFLDIPAATFQGHLAGTPRGSPKPVPLLSDITHEQLVGVLARRERLPGVGVESRAVRAYVSGNVFAHLLGYTGLITKEEYDERADYLLTESIGKSGLERSYEKVLRGTHGARQVEVDAAGNIQNDLGTIPARPGTNLRLHIDAELEERLTTVLAEHLERAGVKKGAAVAVDPRSGAVRAVVSLPTFNHGTIARGLPPAEAERILEDPNEPFLNRALQGQYPPGSTFKLAVAAGALQEQVIQPTTTVESTGGIRVGPWFFPDWKAGGHGRTDIVKALAESVNTFFYIAGGGWNERQGLGIERMTTWARRLGFGRETGIDLPEEASGFLPSPAWKESVKHERWYIGDTYHAAIGQGDILVTPLQLAVATATVANGGTLYKPRVVDALVRGDGSVIETFLPEKRATRVVNQENAALIRRGMRESVLSGSGRALRDLPVAIAGKTGTAQIGTSEKTHAWLTSFAPADEPELVVTVLVEEGGAGERVAVPVAREIYSWYFHRTPPSPTTPTGSPRS